MKRADEENASPGYSNKFRFQPYSNAKNVIQIYARASVRRASSISPTSPSLEVFKRARTESNRYLFSQVDYILL